MRMRKPPWKPGPPGGSLHAQAHRIIRPDNRWSFFLGVVEDIRESVDLLVARPSPACDVSGAAPIGDLFAGDVLSGDVGDDGGEVGGGGEDFFAWDGCGFCGGRWFCPVGEGAGLLCDFLHGVVGVFTRREEVALFVEAVGHVVGGAVAGGGPLAGCLFCPGDVFAEEVFGEVAEPPGEYRLGFMQQVEDGDGAGWAGAVDGAAPHPIPRVVSGLQLGVQLAGAPRDGQQVTGQRFELGVG